MLSPNPPALRILDAGVGDGTVLTRVLRSMHGCFPNIPFYVVGKEVSLEDVRLTLDKVSDRLSDHPGTVFVFTNMYYSEAPWLAAKRPAIAASTVWKEVALEGNTAADFEAQVSDLYPFLMQNWRATASPKTGNPVYERPVVLVIYRKDHRFILNDVIPVQGRVRADFDLIIASQPYRSRTSAEFKSKSVVAPLARALGPGGRLIAVHSCGNDPGMEIIEKVWPDERPFATNRHDILHAVKTELGSSARMYSFTAQSDERAILRYALETLPDEVAGPIGTSTSFAAWNAAIYVAQMADQKVTEVVNEARYLEVTNEVLHKHNGLWFNDECYVITRQPEAR